MHIRRVVLRLWQPETVYAMVMLITACAVQWKVVEQPRQKGVLIMIAAWSYFIVRGLRRGESSISRGTHEYWRIGSAIVGFAALVYTLVLWYMRR